MKQIVIFKPKNVLLKIVESQLNKNQLSTKTNVNINL